MSAQRTKEKIKRTAIGLFNEQETLSVSANRIAKEMGISPGNLYYHYKNKEAIILEIYQEMSVTFESFKSFETILLSPNPLSAMRDVFAQYGELFWEYRFLMRDGPVLMALNPELKAAFTANQEKRIMQITGLLKFLMSEGILEGIPEEEITMRARLYWFISAYWQVFAGTSCEITKASIREAREVLFKLHIVPYLSPKGRRLFDEAFLNADLAVV